MTAILFILDILSFIPGVNLVTEAAAAVIFAFDNDPYTNVYKNNVELTLLMFLVEAVLGFVPTLTLRRLWAKRQARIRRGR